VNFGDRICIDQHPQRYKGKIIFKSSTTLEIAQNRVLQQDMDIGLQVREIAFLLRRSVLSASHNPLPADITISDILKGEVEIPDLLREFFTYLLDGPIQRKGRTISETK